MKDGVSVVLEVLAAGAGVIELRSGGEILRWHQIEDTDLVGCYWRAWSGHLLRNGWKEVS